MVFALVDERERQGLSRGELAARTPRIDAVKNAQLSFYNTITRVEEFESNLTLPMFIDWCTALGVKATKILRAAEKIEVEYGA